ncbi:transcription antitermination factor NusB [Rarobacter incanus]|uniref:Transcription antitermination protein NusB n=1 Tax=Rarobacter incanus TaxID=153494 RepID=A0A542SMZ8_9MICO|nr:transcription antitermination factor NusB [Rarobacter incanus]TQK75617.1 NusB antitermination factor [Rarobacter incanus]
MTKVRSRTKARRRALDILFEAEQRGVAPTVVLADRLIEPGPRQTPPPAYAAEIVQGVSDHLAEIDEILSTYSHGWTIERMPAVDRTGLRIGVWELLYGNDVPSGVVLDEITTMAKELSTDESPNFVNGLLGRVVQVLPMLRA